MIIGFDHEVMSNFGVGVMFIYRKYDNFCGSAQQGCVGSAVRYLDSTANYTGPVAFTAACGNCACATDAATPAITSTVRRCTRTRSRKTSRSTASITGWS